MIRRQFRGAELFAETDREDCVSPSGCLPVYPGNLKATHERKPLVLQSHVFEVITLHVIPVPIRTAWRRLNN